jgi:uncharacterized membrane protein YhaH (DUF805 family)
VTGQQFFWLFFGLSGRISRLPYLLGGLFLAVIQAFILYRLSLVEGDPSATVFWGNLFWMVIVASLWSNFALGVKRLHDIGKPTIFGIVFFIPVLTLIAFIALCLIPGESGPNQYAGTTNAPR